MRYTLHIPVEQYGFVEIEIDSLKDGLTDELQLTEDYQKVKNAFQTGEGLPNREWCKVVDSFVSTGKLEAGADVWARMSKEQQSWISEMNRCLKRLAAKQ